MVTAVRPHFIRSQERLASFIGNPHDVPTFSGELPVLDQPFFAEPLKGTLHSRGVRAERKTEIPFGDLVALDDFTENMELHGRNRKARKFCFQRSVDFPMYAPEPPQRAQGLYGLCTLFLDGALHHFWFLYTRSV